MSALKLEQMNPEQLDVIEYFYTLSYPERVSDNLEEKASVGLSKFLSYVSAVASQPGMLSFLRGRHHEDAFSIYGDANTLSRHVTERLIQEILMDEKNTPYTHRYTTPLMLSDAGSNDAPYMPRFRIYTHTVSFLYDKIEGVESKMWMAWLHHHVAIDGAIHKYYQRRRKPSKLSQMNVMLLSMGVMVQ